MEGIHGLWFSGIYSLTLGSCLTPTSLGIVTIEFIKRFKQQGGKDQAEKQDTNSSPEVLHDKPLLIRLQVKFKVLQSSPTIWQ